MDNISFGVIKWFVSKTFSEVAESVLKATDDAAVLPEDEGIIPIILCEKRDDLKRQGVLCPYEFIIELKDLLPEVDKLGELISKPDEILRDRLRILHEQYGKCTREEFQTFMRDWCAGAFRMYMMLDATTHGTSQFVDLEKAKKREDLILYYLAKYSVTGKENLLQEEGEGWWSQVPEKERKEAANHAQKLYWRFIDDCELTRLNEQWQGTPPKDLARDDLKEHLRTLFEKYFDAVVMTLGLHGGGEDQGNNANHDKTIDLRFDSLCKIYWDEGTRLEGSMLRLLGHNERLPIAYGDRAKYVTPSGKLNLLLIDDKIDESPFAQLQDSSEPFKDWIHKDDWKLLCEVFNVQKLPVGDLSGKDLIEEATRCFRDIQKKGLTYNLILVDLCLGKVDQGVDLDGYAMIRLVKIFFPGTPIVVYSRFNDMGHIARAFFNGAKWFLVKGEEAKLPRHVLSLLKQVGWHREWRTVQGNSNRPQFSYDKENDFSRRFERTQEWQYLTYKSLEYFPGNQIAVQRMGGGISSAVTFKATKGVRLDGMPLQTPSIIKIDTKYNTMMEFERYFRMIRPYMANEAGRVEMPERIINRRYASIVYTFAGKQDGAHDLQSMGSMVENDILCQTTCNYERYRFALDQVFDEILPKIHRVTPDFEVGDIGVRDVISATHSADAFDCGRDWCSLKLSSFPNAYFGEFLPDEFWKSYVARFQPWGRIAVEKLSEFEKQDNNIKLEIGKAKDGEVGTHEATEHECLTFHDVMPDPDPEHAGKMLVEVYDKDMHLIWLDGAASDFVARFRKEIFPGASLWFKMKPELSKEEKGAGRISWLKESFKRGSTKKNGQDGNISGLIEKCTFKLWTTTCSASKIVWQKDGAEDEFSYYTTLQDQAIACAQVVCQDKAGAARWDCRCPVGIIHGDLNLNNIMLESRLHAPKPDDPDAMSTVSDVWFIDFARTRRDLIAHDFNVFFTSTLSSLFGKELLKDKTYSEQLQRNFRTLVEGAVSSKAESLKGVPDSFKDDARLVFVYKMLRRGRAAALKAGVSQNMYLLTTALACLYTLKIFLNQGRVEMAAGFFAAAKICYDQLPQEMRDAGELKEGEADKRKGTQGEGE